jgi:hypothetical protein
MLESHTECDRYYGLIEKSNKLRPDRPDAAGRFLMFQNKDIFLKLTSNGISHLKITNVN